MNTAITIIKAIWPYVAMGGGVTVYTQIVKRLAKLEKKSVIKTVFHSGTLVATGLAYLLGSQNISYVLVILHGGLIGYFGNALYPFVKWIDNNQMELRQALKLVKQGLPAAEQVAESAAQPDAAAPALSAQNTNKTPAPADF